MKEREREKKKGVLPLTMGLATSIQPSHFSKYIYIYIYIHLIKTFLSQPRARDNGIVRCHNQRHTYPTHIHTQARVALVHHQLEEEKSGGKGGKGANAARLLITRTLFRRISLPLRPTILFHSLAFIHPRPSLIMP